MLPSPLRSALEARPSRVETAPPLTLADTVRGSSVAELCARFEVLRVKHKLSIERCEAPADEIAYAHGTGLHWVLQNRTLPDLGVLRGVWRCAVCSHFHGEAAALDVSGVVARPEVCAGCGLSRADTEFAFCESLLVHPELPLRGHPDGFLSLPDREGLGLLEAKSTGSPSAIRFGPRLDHVVQVQSYLLLTDLQWGLILYWNKSGRGIDAWVEHYVERDDDLIAEIVEQLEELRRGLATGSLPERVCEARNAAFATDCPLCSECFQGNPAP